MEQTPIRWPSGWKSPSNIDLLKGTPVNCVLVGKSDDTAGIQARASDAGLTVRDPASPPAGTTIVKGLWPGIRLTRAAGNSDATAGPTGEPWVDSNGWRVRLAQALNGGVNTWIDAAPTGPRLNAAAYLTAFADSASAGGRWIIALDDKLAASLSAREPQALETWNRITAAAAFFNAHKQWDEYQPEAVIGVVSDFTAQTREVLNLIARSNQQYRVIPKTQISDAALRNLRAVIYPDAEPPAPAVREPLTRFARSGGLLVTGPNWGQIPGSRPASSDHPRYALRALGKGKVAIAKENLNDPYLVASDAAMLMSHRYELLRFWNAGATSSHFAAKAGGERAVVQIVFYTTRGLESASVRIAGGYRTAQLWTLDRNEPRPVPVELQENAIEVHLPSISQYAAIELSK